MMRCEHCRSLILDHLYGLLDSSDAVAIETHLRECPACTAAREEAARIQGLIARAAKGAFPSVRFEAPVNPSSAPAIAPPGGRATHAPTTPARVSPAASSNTRTLPFPISFPDVPAIQNAGVASPSSKSPSRGKSARVAVWLPWAVAATVLLAIPGTVIPVLGVLNRAESAHKAAESSVAHAMTVVAETEKAHWEVNQPRIEAAHRLANAIQAKENLEKKWEADQKTAQSQTARKMTVEVRKPATVQPGAPNEFLLVVHDHGAAPTPRVLAEVRDQTDAVIYSQPLDYEKKGENHPLRLPADVWTKLKPQSELFLVVSTVDEKTKVKTELQEKVRLLGPVFATMLVTDRPTYRPGEQVYFRSLTLDRVTFRPPTHDQFLQYELRDPHRHVVHSGDFRLQVAGDTDLVRVAAGKVDPVLGPDRKPIRGVGCGAFALPADLPDGDYTLVLRELPHPAGYPAAIPFLVTRSIQVRAGHAEAYRKMTGYAAASYAAGDVVEAWAELKLQDKPVADAEITAVAVADNEQLTVLTDKPITGADGRANLRFKLPRNLEQADVRLKVTFKTKAGEESVADRVPVIGRNLIVEFFPEGGELVAGVPCRVYVRATTPAGHPVDFRGTITDGRKTLARVETLTDLAQPGANRGIGSFTYTPTLGTLVWLKLESPVGAFAPPLTGPLPVVPPTGIGAPLLNAFVSPWGFRIPVVPAIVAGTPALIGTRSGFPLPKPMTEGVVMTIPNPVTEPGQSINVHLRSVGRTRNLVVGAYTRGRLSDTQRVIAEPGQVAEVRLMTGTDPRGGVVRVTVFEEPAETFNPVGEAGGEEKSKAKGELKPVAERLVFRKPGEALKLDFTTTGPRGMSAAEAGFAPNTLIELSIKATDEKGHPVAAILWAAAINSGVAPGVKDRLLTTHFLLAGEVNTPDAMEYADFLLTDHPKAAASLDLVLATQGWRRFAEQIPQGFVNRPVVATAECAKLLTGNGQYVTVAETSALLAYQKRYETYRPWREEAEKALAAAQAANEAALADRGWESRVRELTTAAQQAREEATALADQANAATTSVERFRGAGWYAIAGFGLLAVMLGTLSLARPTGRLPFGIGTVGSLGLIAFLTIALGMAKPAQAVARVGEDVAKVQLDTRPRFTPSAAQPPAPTPIPGIPETNAQKLPAGAAPGRGGPPEMPGKGRLGADAAFGAPVARPPHGVTVAPPMKDRNENKGHVAGMAGLGGGGSGGLLAPGGPAPPAGPPGLGARGGADDPKGVGPGAVMSANMTPTAGGPPPVAAPGGANGAWHARAAKNDGKKAVPDSDLAHATDPYRLRTPAELRRASQGEGAAVAQDGLKRVFTKAREYALERARTLMEKVDEFALPKGQPSEKQGGGGRPRMATGKEADATPQVDEQAYRVKAALPVVTPLVIREYAAPRPGSAEREGTSPDTILWQPVIVLPSDGKAKLHFALGSAPGGYQVVIAGHTLDGRIGAVRGLIPVVPNPPGPTALPAPVPPTMP